MAYSSDSEDIQITRNKKNSRTKQHSKRSIFDSSDENSLSSREDAEFEPLFLEIFGNGEEYAYIYSANEEKEDSEQSQPRVDEEECLRYVKNALLAGEWCSILLGSLTDEIFYKILGGYSPEYLALHQNRLDVKSCYYVKDLIEEYKAYSKMPKQHQNGSSYFSQSANKNDDTDFNMNGLLNITEYVKNLLSMTKEHEPSEQTDIFIPSFSSDSSLNLDATKTKYKRVINQLAKNSVFQDRVYKLYENSLITGKSSYEPVIELYCTRNRSNNDLIRKVIIEEAIERVNINKKSVFNKMVQQGLIEGENKQRLVDFNDFSGLASLIVNLWGRSGRYAGIYQEKGYVKIALLDESGHLVGTSIFKDSDYMAIREFIGATEMVCISAQSPAVKYFIQNLGIPIYYVPKELSLFADYKEFSIAFNIAAVVQNPFVYFSRMSKSHGYSISTNDYVAISPFYKGIQLAISLVKPDWRTMAKYKNSHMLFEILNLCFTDQHFDYENVDSLEKLNEVFSEAQFANIGTFFTLEDSSQPLDASFVHPRDYSMATVICTGAYFSLNGHMENTGSRDIVSSMLKRSSDLHTVNLPNDNPEEYYETKCILDQLTVDKPRGFNGANDEQIFNDVVYELKEGEVYEGTVVKDANDYLIVEVKGAAVFVRKISENYDLNQNVKVEVVKKVVAMLNYTGTIVHEKSVSTGHMFEKHPLFRNVPHETLLHMLRNSSDLVLLRPSSVENSFVVVCKIKDRLFFLYRVSEINENCYEHQARKYTSIDHFIATYIKGVFKLVREIFSFKYYFDCSKTAIPHLQNGGNYLRYAVSFSEENPGYLEFYYKNKKAMVKIDSSSLVYKNTAFPNLMEFISYAKKNFI
ncbi:hypothetical protein ENBRE01_0158 [Enteropsectra breve]|nr:hypothetical protein ENBRE01_0158 [Enteropsectra breve]